MSAGLANLRDRNQNPKARNTNQEWFCFASEQNS